MQGCIKIRMHQNKDERMHQNKDMDMNQPKSKDIEIGYKIVCPMDGKLLSIMAHGYYRVDEWVYPEIGKLFVFKDFDSACNCFSPDLRIYKAEVCNVKTCRIIAPPMYNHLWGRYWMGLDTDKIAFPPDGTYICDSVKLIEPIKQHL